MSLVMRQKSVKKLDSFGMSGGPFDFSANSTRKLSETTRNAQLIPC